MRRFSLFTIVLLGGLLLAGCGGNVTPPLATATPTQTSTVTQTPTPVVQPQYTENAFLMTALINRYSSQMGWKWASGLDVSPKGTWILGLARMSHPDQQSPEYKYVIVKYDGSDVIEIEPEVPAGRSNTELEAIGWTSDEDCIFLTEYTGSRNGWWDGSLFSTDHNLYKYCISSGQWTPVELPDTGRGWKYGITPDGEQLIIITQGPAEQITFRSIETGEEHSLSLPRSYSATTRAFNLGDHSGFILIGYSDSERTTRIDILKVGASDLQITPVADGLDCGMADIYQDPESRNLLLACDGAVRILNLQTGELDQPLSTQQP